MDNFDRITWVIGIGLMYIVLVGLETFFPFSVYETESSFAEDIVFEKIVSNPEIKWQIFKPSKPLITITAPNSTDFIDADFFQVGLNEGCYPVPCECHDWGCALYCYVCAKVIGVED